MRGLLYKDYVACKGKVILIAMAGVTIFLLFLRILIPGGDAKLQEDIYDCLLASIIISGVLCLIILPSSAILLPVIKADEKNKTYLYIKALPIKKNEYIASRYVFFAICHYIFLIIGIVWLSIFYINAGTNEWSELVSRVIKSLPAFVGLSMSITSIELAFLLILGSKKGQMIKVFILEIIMLVCIAYLFFGDLNILENFNIFEILTWVRAHNFIINLISIITPIVTLFTYWITYRIVCKIKNKI